MILAYYFIPEATGRIFSKGRYLGEVASHIFITDIFLTKVSTSLSPGVDGSFPQKLHLKPIVISC